MKELLAICFLALSCSLDNFAAGMSYGLRNTCISTRLNILIACVNTSGTLLSMLAGHRLSTLLNPEIGTYIGAGILIVIGAKLIFVEIRAGAIRYSRPIDVSEEYSKKSFWQAIFAVSKNPFAAGAFCSGFVSAREGAALAAGLTMTNLSTGIGAGMIGYPLLYTNIAVFIASLIAVAAGTKTGSYSSVLFVRAVSAVLSGVLLVTVGVLEVVG